MCAERRAEAAAASGVRGTKHQSESFKSKEVTTNA